MGAGRDSSGLWTVETSRWDGEEIKEREIETWGSDFGPPRLEEGVKVLDTQTTTGWET